MLLSNDNKTAQFDTQHSLVTVLPRIAVVNNDPDLLEVTLNHLQNLNYYCWGASCGGDFYRQLLVNPVSIVILDIDLPGENGLSIAQYLRDMPDLGIIIISSSSHEERIYGLNIGADRYLSRPIHLDELVANIMALARRNPVITKPEIIVAPTVNAWNLCSDNWTLTSPCGRMLKLTDREYRLMLLLIEAHGQIVNKQDIANELIGPRIANASVRVDTQLARLRKKAYLLLGYQLPIKTAYQIGYAFTEQSVIR